MSRIRSSRFLGLVALLGGAALLAGCERPPIQTIQTGYRGTGMLQVYNPRTLEQQIPLNQPPAAMDPGSPDGPKAKDVLKNVKVLGDLSVAQFTNQMNAITAWVAPKDGCAYCHDLQDLSADTKYQKVVARRMLQMTRHVNADWKAHVAATGVTCYTCHRGNPVPSYVWNNQVGPDNASPYFIGNRNGQNQPSMNVGLAALPIDPYTPYLQQAAQIRIASQTALPTGNKASIQSTEGTYALMVHFSYALGVNCTYCHNSRSFGAWDQSSPKRTTAWHGIRMVNDLNKTYLDPLAATLPDNRKGPAGDAPKAFCTTCHQGAYKPVYGAQMAKDWPGLQGTPQQDAAALPAPVADARRSVLYFGVASPQLEGPQAEGLVQLIATLKADPAAKVTISGFHSAAGTLAQNQDLAKQRALNVRDALVSAGIAESRVALAKPQQTEANVSGEDPTARRVEVAIR